MTGHRRSGQLVFCFFHSLLCHVLLHSLLLCQVMNSRLCYQNHTIPANSRLCYQNHTNSLLQAIIRLPAIELWSSFGGVHSTMCTSVRILSQVAPGWDCFLPRALPCCTKILCSGAPAMMLWPCNANYATVLTFERPIHFPNEPIALCPPIQGDPWFMWVSSGAILAHVTLYCSFNHCAFQCLFLGFCSSSFLAVGVLQVPPELWSPFFGLDCSFACLVFLCLEASVDQYCVW